MTVMTTTTTTRTRTNPGYYEDEIDYWKTEQAREAYERQYGNSAGNAPCAQCGQRESAHTYHPASMSGPEEIWCPPVRRNGRTDG